jgi:hypothetical protein
MATINSEGTAKRQAYPTMDQWALQGPTQFLEFHAGVFSLLAHSFHVSPLPAVKLQQVFCQLDVT